MKKIFSKTAALIMVSIFLISSLSGCGLINAVKTISDAASESDKSEAKTVTSKDGAFQVTAPSDWLEVDNLNEEAVLQISKASEEKYLMVLSESKEDFSADVTLEDYLNAIVENYKLSDIKNLKIDPTTDITINGYKAKQYELTGEVKKLKIAYIVTIVDGNKSFYQIVSWSLQSKYEQNKEALKEVISSFKEVSK